MSTLRYRIAFDADTAGIEVTRRSLQGLKQTASIAGSIIAAKLAGAMARAVASGAMWNAHMEDSRMRLAQVTRSAAQAGDRLRQLQDLESKSRFDATELAEASRQLQVMSNGALAGARGMQMVADIAAGTNSGVSQTADAVGRLWMALRSGRDAGRGLMALEQMGAVSADLRARLDRKAKSGADFSAMWGAVEEDFARFAGAAEKAAGTVSGQMQLLRRSF